MLSYEPRCFHHKNAGIAPAVGVAGMIDEVNSINAPSGHDRVQLPVTQLQMDRHAAIVPAPVNFPALADGKHFRNTIKDPNHTSWLNVLPGKHSTLAADA